jgi:hypothetical protein
MVRLIPVPANRQQAQPLVVKRWHVSPMAPDQDIIPLVQFPQQSDNGDGQLLTLPGVVDTGAFGSLIYYASSYPPWAQNGLSPPMSKM